MFAQHKSRTGFQTTVHLTLSSPVVSNSYTSKSSEPYWSNPHFLIFWHSGTLALRAKRQSAQMSEIKNRGLNLDDQV